VRVLYGVLADVHGNLPALEAALVSLERRGVDRYLVAGDLVGYGPFPNECVAAVAALDAVCVAGNHDLIALGELSDAKCIPLARKSLEWTRRVLDADARAFLEALPRRIDVADRITLAHGSLDDPSEYTLLPEQASSQLRRLEKERPEIRILVLGHTHRQWACDQTPRTARPAPDGSLPLGDARWVLNPGAVGQSRGLRVHARSAILDLERSTMTFESLSYDTRRCRDELRRHGLHPRSYHLPPSPVRRLRRIVRQARRRRPKAGRQRT
jgi:predicted phosphodiesterase